MRIYLDHAATTYVDKKVLDKMTQCYCEIFGNTSSQHTYGRDAEKGVGAARVQVAKAIGAAPGEIYFTSGGTESDNWAVKGVAKFAKKGHIITTGIEHQAVLYTCKYLQAKGYSVTYLPVDEFGRVSPGDVENALHR